MKRLLVVAGDRALTKFVAEALLGRSLTQFVPRSSDPWDISRAHTATEAFLLVTRGGRPFDVLVVDHVLPDQEPLELVDRLRKTDEARDVPIFFISERGRDQHSRRIASESYDVAGFIEKPVTIETLRSALGSLERKRRVLLVEPRAELAERYRAALAQAGFLPEVTARGRDALDRAPRFRPDLVISALELDDMRGADVCMELKRARGQASVPVILYGQVALLASQEISENALRADDFVQAPFDEGVLVERAASLVGRGVVPAPRRRSLVEALSEREAAARATMEGPARTMDEPAAGAGKA
ncbi:response regulator, partial [Myxococcota bacterium]|nr:response regulator [Myxococcota bacterium]